MIDLIDFFGKDYSFIWSDNWCIEDDGIWFVAGAIDILFHIDCEKNKVNYAIGIPTGKICTFRGHPRCLKRGDNIYCLPDKGQDIWCFHLAECVWKKIEVQNTQKVRLLCSNAWFFNNRLYIVSIGLGQIIELDLKSERIINQYNLCDKNEIELSGSLLVEHCIYIVGNYPISICKFDCLTKEIIIFDLMEIEDKIQTICFDGDRFWLSGRRKKIYIWKEGQKVITTLTNFPYNFGIYNFSGKFKNLINFKENVTDFPIFIASVNTNSYVWFIPFHANQILYIDKKTFEIKEFLLTEEDQTEQNIKTQLLGHKYLLEYVRDSRFIGLFSLKNKWILEIDSYKLSYKVPNYKLSTDYEFQIKECIRLESIAKLYYRDNLIVEGERLELNNFIYGFLEKCRKDMMFKKSGNSTIGKNIYYVLRD